MKTVVECTNTHFEREKAAGAEEVAATPTPFSPAAFKNDKGAFHEAAGG